MPASKRATEETSKPVAKAAAKPGVKVAEKAIEKSTKAPVEAVSPARQVVATRKPSKTALSPGEVTPLALLTPSKPARRRRSGAAKPRKLKGATTTWPFPTGSRP